MSPAARRAAVPLAALLLAAPLLAGVLPAAGPAGAQDDAGATSDTAGSGGRYEIVQAGPDRVWRLDTETGVVSVCSLSGDRLVCTASSEAARPPERSYEQLQAERKAAERQETQEQLRVLDRMLTAFKEIVSMLIRHEAGQPGEGGGGA